VRRDRPITLAALPIAVSLIFPDGALGAGVSAAELKEAGRTVKCRIGAT